MWFLIFYTVFHIWKRNKIILATNTCLAKGMVLLILVGSDTKRPVLTISDQYNSYKSTVSQYSVCKLQFMLGHHSEFVGRALRRQLSCVKYGFVVTDIWKFVFKMEEVTTFNVLERNAPDPFHQ